MMMHVIGYHECIQVSAPVDVETNKLASDIADISIKEESSNASNTAQDNALPNQKEATVGSLSFTVTSTASSRPNESTTKLVPTQANISSLKSPAQKNSVKKPTVRAKVPFEKGYSQMDWLKLTQTHPDLAGSHTQFFYYAISIIIFVGSFFKISSNFLELCKRNTY